jgi:hypothetical protein
MAEVTKSIWPKQATCAILVGVSDIPHFAYPGGKARHAKRIISLFPPVGDRFVDVFAGRGSITWAVMSLLNYRRYWINAMGTYDFFDGIGHSGIYAVPPRDRKLFDRMKRRMKEPIRKHAIKVLPLDLVRIQELPADLAPLGSIKHGHVRIVHSDAPRASNPAHPAPLLEGYVSRDGGTFGSMRTGAGITKEGMSRLLGSARVLLEKNWKRTKLTAIDYRDVLVQCRPGDLVYL